MPLSLGMPSSLRAQGGVLLQGIADAEFWSTDTGSSMLTRNHGRPGALGRLALWGAVEPWRGFVVYAQGYAEGGPAYEDGTFEADLDQLGVRYTATTAFVIDAGKMPHPVGAFSGRRFSTRNPLIGAPDGYPVQYPLGVQLSGATRRLDWRVAVISLPVSHPGYVPNPEAAARPALGAGFTLFTGLRIGASTTWGPYLNGALPATLFAGQSWRTIHQRIAALDVQFSRGYLDVHAEWARGSYDVPGRNNAVTGETYYADAKYAIGPRLFVAARAERNNYPFIRPAGASSWVARLTEFDNGEIGAGYRISASLLGKLSYRADRWHLTPAQRAFLGAGGHALAVQLSQAFDVVDLLERSR